MHRRVSVPTLGLPSDMYPPPFCFRRLTVVGVSVAHASVTASVPSVLTVLPERSFATSAGIPVRFVVAYTPVVVSVAWAARFVRAPVYRMALLVVRLASAERTNFIAFELQT